MRFKRFISTVAAFLMGAAMTLGSAVPAAADTDTSANVYPLFLKDGSTTNVSMVQAAMVDDQASSYNSATGTLTLQVQKFTVTRAFVSGTGYLRTITLYVDNDGEDGYTDGDTVFGSATVNGDLKKSSPSKIDITGIDSSEYDIMQKYIVDAYVTYDMTILTGNVYHNHNEADFTLHNSFVKYDDAGVTVDLNGKTKYPTVTEE